MGFTWLLGVLVVEVKALLPLAYIYTILVAFQGVFIFLCFVVFCKQVRDEYVKWWLEKVKKSDFLTKYFGSRRKTTPIGMVWHTCIRVESRESLFCCVCGTT